MKYFDELKISMLWLAEQKNTIFMGQAVGSPGTAMYTTLDGVPSEKRLELPVAEELQSGMSLGMALEGLVPISIFPRMDFMMCCMNSLVNHIDKIGIMSQGEYKPKTTLLKSVESIYKIIILNPCCLRVVREQPFCHPSLYIGRLPQPFFAPRLCR